MTLDEAINLLSYLSETRHLNLLPPEWDALQLGIEALKHCKEYRETNECAWSWLLPGETHE